MTRVLAIDTSTRAGSIALAEGNQLIEAVSLNDSTKRHAQTLVAEIAALCQRHGTRPASLDVIAVAKGPGSFTGLRVGMTCAKTLAYSLRKPLVCVDSFDATAAQLPREISSAWIIDDAQRDELFVCRYVRSASDALLIKASADAARLANVETWNAERCHDDNVAGPGILKSRRAGKFRSEPRWFEITSNAASVAALAHGRIVASDVDDVWQAAPFYIRPSGAEEKAQLQAGAVTNPAPGREVSR